jgi:hypothetical protein
MSARIRAMEDNKGKCAEHRRRGRSAILYLVDREFCCDK